MPRGGSGGNSRGTIAEPRRTRFKYSMSKTVISLVKELGVKSTQEVLALLRAVGVNVDAEGFGVMSRIDDAIIAKVKKAGSSPAPAEPAAAPPPSKPA